MRAAYEELAPPVLAYLRGHGVAAAEDVLHEVFLAVFTGLARFEGDGRGFRSWVFTIAHHKAVDDVRRRARRPEPVPYQAEQDRREAASAEQEALAALSQARVHELLARLTEDQREVLLLRVVADLTVEQVAAALGKPIGAVKALQRRGLDALRRIVHTEGVPL